MVDHQFRHNLKISKIGKTSLCVRYAHNTFEPSHLSTIQAALITKKLKVRNGEKVMVDFCDTAGQKRFHSLGSIYYKKADAAIVVFDRTDSKSLQEGFSIHNFGCKHNHRILRLPMMYSRFMLKPDKESERLDFRIAKVIIIIIPNYSGGKQIRLKTKSDFSISRKHNFVS